LVDGKVRWSSLVVELESWLVKKFGDQVWWSSLKVGLESWSVKKFGDEVW
jgi:hypothetical protein